MRKSMNNMNAMERLNAATNNVNDAAMNRILDGSINLDGLHAMKNIDMNKCETPIQVMQKIYNAESLVGAVTTVVGNICNVDVTIPAGFAEFKESLLQLKDKSVHVPYGDSIWVDGVNVLRGYHFVTGHFYCYYVVTNAEMKAIETKVKNMSKKQMTVADAQALQSDLGPILRAWQESSIDCTKDKDKKFNYDFRNFFKKIDVISTFCKKHADEIELNTKEVFKDNSKDFRITLPSDNNEEVHKDLVGKVTETIRTSAEELYNTNVKHIYSLATMDAYKPFMGYAKQHPEFSLFVKEIFYICYNSNAEVGAKITEEQYATMRNVIYSKAIDCNVEIQDVVKIAIDVAMTPVKETKDGIVVGSSNVDNFRDFPVKDIFPREYQVTLTNKPYMETIATDEDITALYRNITDGETIEFINGNSIETMIIEDEETKEEIEVHAISLINNFTGTAIEYNGVLVAEANVYEFNGVDAALVFKTFAEDATPRNLTYDKEAEYFVSLRKEDAFNGFKVTGKNGNILRNDDHLIGVFRGTRRFAKDERIITDMNNVITFKPRNGNQRYFLVIVK